MAGPERIRTAWLCNAPGPNTSDFFDALAKVPECDVDVFYCAAEHKKWRGSFSVSGGYRHRVLWNANPFPQRVEALHLNPGVLSAFRTDAYDIAVIGGTAYPTAALAMATRWLAKRPYAVWGEMVNRGANKYRRATQAHSVHALVRRADAAFTMGPRGRQSFREVGVPPDRIQELPYCCNLQPYLAVKRGASRGPRERRRVATLCQLIPRKRVDLIIDAFAELAPAFPDWDLSVAGTGPLSEALERGVPEELRHRVEFAGFVGKAEQPAFYESVDLFVLASQQDGWGMVIPEAMASGLPVVSTRGVESAVEMLAGGGGALVRPKDGPALREAMRRFMADVSLCETEGERARAVAKRFSPPAIAERAAQDLRRVLHRSG